MMAHASATTRAATALLAGTTLTLAFTSTTPGILALRPAVDEVRQGYDFSELGAQLHASDATEAAVCATLQALFDDASRLQQLGTRTATVLSPRQQLNLSAVVVDVEDSSGHVQADTLFHRAVQILDWLPNLDCGLVSATLVPRLLHNAAFTKQALGDAVRAIDLYERAVDAAETTLPDATFTDPHSATAARLNLAALLEAVHARDRAAAVRVDLLRATGDVGVMLQAATALPTVLWSSDQGDALQHDAHTRVRELLDLVQGAPVTDADDGRVAWGPELVSAADAQRAASACTNPQRLTRWSPMVSVWYHTSNVTSTRALAADVTRMYAAVCPLLAAVAPHLADADGSAPEVKRPDSRVRVGFVSQYLHPQHSLSRHIGGILGALDPSRFDVRAVVIGGADAANAERGASQATTVRHLRGVLGRDAVTTLPSALDDMDAARHAIARLELDVLVYPETAMSSMAHALSYSRLAPVQITTWCFPVTSGHADTIDYFVSSDGLQTPWHDASDAQDSFTEQVVRFSDGPPWAFMPQWGSDGREPGDAEAITAGVPTWVHEGLGSRDLRRAARHAFGLPPATVDRGGLYVCLQSLAKLHPSFDDVLVALMARDSEAVVVFVSTLAGADAEADVAQQLVLDRWFEVLEPHMARLLFVPRLPQRTYLRLLAIADVVLDTAPWGGFTTTLDAVAVGTPVVTLVGRDTRGRFAARELERLGVADDCVATTADDAARLAVRLSSDDGARELVVAKLAAGRDWAGDYARSTREWSRFLERVARR